MREPNWQRGEDGPMCSCGLKTAILVTEDGEAFVFCFAHTREEACTWKAPSFRPEGWPKLTDEEIDRWNRELATEEGGGE